MRKLHKGDTVVMTDSAVHHYGAKWRGVELVVTRAANKSMPAEQFFKLGKPEGFHPAYDTGVGGWLYDLKRVDTGEALAISLYDWELQGN